MVEPSTNSAQCQCGYDRTGLSADAVCPECGKLEIQQSTRRKNLIQAWRSSKHRHTRSEFVMSAMTLAAGLGNSAFAIYLLITLMRPGFKGSTAGLALMYPPLIWLAVILPLGCLAIGSRVSRRDVRDSEVPLRDYTSLFTTFGLVIPVVVMFLICAGAGGR